jgi:AAA family ATP:ADP antiporter
MPAERTDGSALAGPIRARLESILGVKSDEILLAFLAFAYFFLLLCGYFIIRPIRDNMGIEFGTARLPYLFGYIFAVMLAAVPLYGWVVSRFPKGRIVPIAYGCFGLQILAFYFLLRSSIDQMAIAPVFFVWVSVFNLFVVSIFWSYMVDVFSPDRANRLFGFIAAGGTLGALVGPLITQALVRYVGIPDLLLISLAFLLAALFCVLLINRIAGGMPASAPSGQRVGESAFSGLIRVCKSRYLLMIAIWVFLGDILSTILYLEQQTIVGQTIANSDARVQLLARLDLATSVLTVLLQILATEKIIRHLGVGFAIAVLPIITIACFMGLAFAPTLAVIATAQVVSRGFGFGITNPARHILFSTVSLDEKYKAQNVIDTLVQRSGDAAGGSCFAALLSGAGLGLAAISAVAIPVTAFWLALCGGLGRRHNEALGRLRGRNDAAVTGGP